MPGALPAAGGGVESLSAISKGVCLLRLGMRFVWKGRIFRVVGRRRFLSAEYA